MYSVSSQDSCIRFALIAVTVGGWPALGVFPGGMEWLFGTSCGYIGDLRVWLEALMGNLFAQGYLAVWRGFQSCWRLTFFF